MQTTKVENPRECNDLISPLPHSNEEGAGPKLAHHRQGKATAQHRVSIICMSFRAPFMLSQLTGLLINVLMNPAFVTLLNHGKGGLQKHTSAWQSLM